MSRSKKTFYPNFIFYWATQLSEEQMEKIDKWVGTLTKEQKRFLDDLLSDRYNEGRGDEAEANEEY